MHKRIQRSFDVEFKKAAVARMELGECVSALALELGIARSVLYRWRIAQRAGRFSGVIRAGLPAVKQAPAATRAMAGAHAAEAMTALADIMKNGKSEASRIAAANAILDRAHGKPGQPADAKPKAESEVVTRIERIIVDHRN